ncbi:Protein of unknown function [Pyronema omphalodes CBS 100304]|uniref:Uncharacterized protein n=1 Tax=Pyronema omphalodes (strain CBS 100304) TaxID=1076935 RepID=U4LN09_PYROM|nr:Protein of unknown function [Pyronema omphalodes CBS 100304]
MEGEELKRLRLACQEIKRQGIPPGCAEIADEEEEEDIKKRKVVSLQVGNNKRKRAVRPVSYATNPDQLSAIPAAMPLSLTMEPHSFDYYKFAKMGPAGESGLPFGYGIADNFRMPHESQLHDNVRIVRNQHDADEALPGATQSSMIGSAPTTTCKRGCRMAEHQIWVYY